MAEVLWKLLKKSGEPPLTRFVAVELAKDHYFNIGQAIEDLGFRPAHAMDEALEATIEDLRQRGF